MAKRRGAVDRRPNQEVVQDPGTSRPKQRDGDVGILFFFMICAARGVEVVMLDAQSKVPSELQLTEDHVEILTVFSSRVYGSRSHKNRRANAK